MVSRARAGEGIVLYDVVNDRWIFARCTPTGELYVSAVIPGVVNVDVIDRWARQLGQVDLARVLGAPLSAVNPVIAGLYDAAGNRMPSMDAAIRPGYVDVIDRVARLLGIIYGDVGQLAQRAVTRDAYVQLRNAGIEIDPRDVSDRWARQLGQVDVARVLGAALSVANPMISGIYDAAGNRMPSMDVAARPGYVDVIDRWARQVGQVDLARVLGAALTSANPVIAGIFDAAGNRMPSMDVAARAGFVDVIDRAARLVGVVYGSQASQLLQRAATFDLLVQLRSAGAEVDPRDANYEITTVSNLIDEIGYTWNADGTCNTAVYKKGGAPVFTITYTWNADKTLNKQVRT